MLTSLVLAVAINFLFASNHDVQRCVQLTALSVITIIFLVRARYGHAYAISKVTVALLTSFFGLGLVSVIMAHSLRHAVYEWAILLLLLVSIFSNATGSLQGSRFLADLLHRVGIVCVLYSLKLITMYAAALASGFQVDMHSLAIGFSNARFLNHTQTALLPLIVLLCLRVPPSGGWHKVWFVLAAFWWSLLFVSEARASVLALSAGCMTAFALRRSHARQFIMAMIWTALAGVVLYALLFILLPMLVGLQPVGSPMNVVARTAADPTSARNLLWKLALNLIVAHPWLGAGPQHFAHEGATLYAAAHPHNWMLQIAAEWGVPALSCLLGVVYLGARALVRSGASIADDDRPNQQILVTFLVACMAIFVDGLLSGVIVMPQSQLAIVLVLGMAYAWVRQQGGRAQPVEPARSALAHIVFLALVTTALSGLIWSVAPDFVARARGDALTPAELAVNPTTHWPRMWEAGYF